MRCPSGSLASPAGERGRAHGEPAGTAAGKLPPSPLFWRTRCPCLPGRPTPSGACWLPSTLQAPGQMTPSSGARAPCPLRSPKEVWCLVSLPIATDPGLPSSRPAATLFCGGRPCPPDPRRAYPTRPSPPTRSQAGGLQGAFPHAHGRLADTAPRGGTTKETAA